MTYLFLCSNKIVKSFFKFFFIFFIFNSCWAHNPTIYNHWFTGTLLIPTPITMKVGHPALETTYFFRDDYGEYSNNNQLVNFDDIISNGIYVDFQFALNEKIGFEYIGAGLIKTQRNFNKTGLTDTILRLGYQISTDNHKDWTPDLRVLIQEILPSGRFKNLSENHPIADALGEGSVQTGIYLSSQKYFSNHQGKPYRIRAALGYFIPRKVSVENFNAYGGGIGTIGTVSPGQYINAFFGFEYELSKDWSFAVESKFNYTFKGSFDGFEGRTIKGKSADIDILDSYQWFVSPEVQHIFSEHLGVFMGAPFTILGKNSLAFASLFFSLLYIF